MSQLIEVKVPDIGDFSDIPVIEINIAPGDSIQIDDSLLTLESDKATMDVPSPVAGVVMEIKVRLNDRVSNGTVVALVEVASVTEAPAKPVEKPDASAAVVSSAELLEIIPEPAKPAAPQLAATNVASSVAAFPSGGRTHASPSVRFYARELGVDLSKVSASGPKSRVLREDISNYVKGLMQSGLTSATSSAPGLGGGLDLLPWPKVDFTKFGEVEVKPLSRIKKISGQNLARNWVMIPAVTYHEEADITELEAFRVAMNKENEKSGAKVTMLAFIIKACEMGLKKFPEFNSSLDGDNLVLKRYFNIAFAADTPNGLVVPVIKNVDQKSVSQLAIECGELAKKARDGKLTPPEMSGACFTISSVGGIGGTLFSPIINAPEVAILGVSKSVMKPVWNGKEFVPRLTLPLSLTADHRVVDGALATRFNAYIAALLADMRRVLI